MTWIVSTRCDICGKPKGDANGWLLFTLPGGGGICFSPWNDKQAFAEEVRHLCGPRCAMTALERWSANNHEAAMTAASRS